MDVKIVGIASDHAGYALKQFVKKYLEEKGYEYKDYGTYTEDSCDYSDFGHALVTTPLSTSPLQFFPSQHQLRTRFVVELRGDVQALRLGQLVAGSELAFEVFVFNQPKIRPVDFHPCWLHPSNGLHHVFVLFTCQLGNFERRHHLLLVVIVVSDVCV